MSTICIFGDSITWGEGDPTGGGWVARLKRYYEENNWGVSLYNLGVDAETSVGLVARFKSEALVREPDVLVIAIGINDSVYRQPGEQPLVTLEDFATNIDRLASEAQSIAQKIVFIGLTKVDEARTQPFPLSSTGKCYSNSRISKYDRVIMEACLSKKLNYLNVFNLIPKSELIDGLHPNEEGHKKMFNIVKDLLQKGNVITSPDSE